MADNIAEVKRLLGEITQADRTVGHPLPPLEAAYKRIDSMKHLAQDALDLLEVDRIEREAA